MIACRKCGKISTDRRLRKRKNYTCGDCIKAARDNPNLNPNLVPMACDGCGRVAYVRPSKIERCDTYFCAGRWNGCKHNPDHRPPKVPEGHVGIHTDHAAGCLSGYSVRLATDEELMSINRARGLRDAAAAGSEFILESDAIH